MRKTLISTSPAEKETISVSLELQEAKALNNLLVEHLTDCPDMVTYSIVQSKLQAMIERKTAPTSKNIELQK